MDRQQQDQQLAIGFIKRVDGMTIEKNDKVRRKPISIEIQT